jgi:broad specificity phosphatase PhoE
VPAILLVRHAQASYGGADYDALSPLAPYQNRALRAHLSMRSIGQRGITVVAGPGRRHRETAEQVCPDTPVEVDEAWDEYSSPDLLGIYGDAEANGASLTGDTHLSSREFQHVLDRALAKWIEDRAGTWKAFSERTHDALRGIGSSLTSGSLGMVFTSAGAIASVAATILGADSAFVALNRVQVNTGVTKVVSGRSGLTLVSFNAHSHLELVDPALVTYR